MSARKHSGVQSLFNKEFIKTELIDEEFSDIFNEVKIIRENSDYDYFYIIDKGMVNENLIRVEQFVEEMDKFVIGVLNGKINI